MTFDISVAEKLRATAHLCRADGLAGIFVSRSFLFDLAKELEPDYVDSVPELHAVSYIHKYEAVGFIGFGGWLHWTFAPRAHIDMDAWAKAYSYGYRDARFGVPVIRPPEAEPQQVEEDWAFVATLPLPHEIGEP